ncbi:MAG TPA: cell wall hydrolase [Candidatus Paceibacterota bacterium]|nr:cell wall hydrolase [Candidatus Paceibacterota bacterium]
MATTIERSLKMRYLCVLAFLLAMCAAGEARSDQTSEEAFYRSQIIPMALNVYHEGRGEPELGQYMIAYVTLMRAADNRKQWGGKTIKGVVFKGCQFSWTCDPKIKQKAPSGLAWEKAKAIATWVALGFFEPPGELLKNARYYMNPDTSDPENRCWMATTFRQAGIVGNHYFYSQDPAWLVPPRFKCGKFVSVEPPELTS